MKTHSSGQETRLRPHHQRHRRGDDRQVRLRHALLRQPTGLSEFERKQLLFERLYGESLPLTALHYIEVKITEGVRKYAAEVYAKA